MTAPIQPRVLVIRGGAIGDFILTLPALKLLRENIAGAHIEVLGYPGIMDLAITAGLADAVRSLEHRTMAPLFAKNATLDEEVIRYFNSFNLVISYLYDPDGLFRASMERIGVKTFIEASHRVSPGAGSAAAQLARPLEKLAMYLEDPAPVILPHRPQSDLIAIHPGSGSLSKNWPLDRWIEMGRRIQHFRPESTLILVTGEAEQERGITAAWHAAAEGLRYRHLDSPPLSELAHHLSECSAFIGHDSGISHLAAACGVPCLLFFGPTDPTTWAPQNSGVKVHLAPEGNLAQLTVDEAWDAAKDFLASKNT